MGNPIEQTVISESVLVAHVYWLPTPSPPGCSPQGVYCTGGGFEIQINGNWSLAKSELARSPANSVHVILPKDVATQGVVQRVRYAYADWPVVSVRNDDGIALPARLFDLPVTS